MRRTRNPVYGFTVSRVRIPPFPPASSSRPHEAQASRQRPGRLRWAGRVLLRLTAAALRRLRQVPPDPVDLTVTWLVALASVVRVNDVGGDVVIGAPRVDRSGKNPSMHRFALRFAATAIVAGMVALPGLALAANRCTDAQGRVTFQDAPCPGAVNAEPPASRSAAGAATQPTAAGGYSTARGTWRGPAQLHVVEGANRDLGAHRVVPTVIELGVDGKVTGVIPEAGCRLSGLTSTFVSATNASVDVTLTGCQDSRFNTRMTGHLFVHSGEKEARLNLNANAVRPNLTVRQVSLQAVLRR
jgi:hypothetical protein